MTTPLALRNSARVLWGATVPGSLHNASSRASMARNSSVMGFMGTDLVQGPALETDGAEQHGASSKALILASYRDAQVEQVAERGAPSGQHQENPCPLLASHRVSNKVSAPTSRSRIAATCCIVSASFVRQIALSGCNIRNTLRIASA